jgi:hypothetical protein
MPLMTIITEFLIPSTTSTLTVDHDGGVPLPLLFRRPFDPILPLLHLNRPLLSQVSITVSFLQKPKNIESFIATR